jgi:hypothetical protein
MRRRLPQALVLALVLVAAASVSVRCGRRLAITDVGGAGVPGAFVAYHDEGSAFGIADSVTYQASAVALARSDDSGVVVIPASIHLRWPIVQNPPALQVDLVYAPALHNGLASISRHGAVSRPREFDVSEDRTRVRLEDVSGDPLLWEGTLMNLGGLLGQLTSRPGGGGPTARLTADLADRFAGEYAVILERYGTVDRPRPEMPIAVSSGTDEEKRAWRAMIDDDLARRPRWGDELRRRFATEVAAYRSRTR